MRVRPGAYPRGGLDSVAPLGCVLSLTHKHYTRTRVKRLAGTNNLAYYGHSEITEVETLKTLVPGQISWSVCSEKISRGKRSSLLWSIVSDEEKSFVTFATAETAR